MSTPLLRSQSLPCLILIPLGDSFVNVFSDLDKNKATEDTIELAAFGSASLQFAQGADKKVAELWGDVEWVS